ncbi:MAG TPA: glycerophosphodiester phosphodiesterase family protein [Leptospiraceae bacterium]|nr:glycerophosphodiester phosphodiesterase family protein [Leptospiraceae bacterium]HMW05331.1 glycerophosphodiester phosphodiesterase family protein [Leptospiraceae bacterium]HMX32912.1 glycerophosphodiester phosphodiesterase family protein [Leptospiraceae bacterium]HMY31527.1 glycerophosphodiester phosphodiesterase family protein [Leptospiraceae bacterium]HMZ67391.1 glycerophosphodiester phosphodiesterase family protein [Leptospiraceae bacterium]
MKYFHSLLIPILFVSYTACASHNPRTKKVEEVIPQKFLVIGHRGTGDNSIAPENTLSSFRFAAKNKSAFELDTMFAKSGELVVIHDSDVDRTTNGKGMVDSLTLTELKQLDASKLSNPKFKGEKIPTLEEVLNEFGGKTLVDIEIKAQAPKEEAQRIGAAVAKLVGSKKLEKQVFVTSFNPYVLETIKHTNPEILRGQLYSNFDDVKELSWIVKVVLRNLLLNGKAEPDILAPREDMVNSDYIEKYHGLGYKIFPWTVNDPVKMEKLIKLGVDGLITDRPDLANEIYEKLKNQ